MTEEQLNLMIKLIDAKITEAAACASSDGGGAEWLHVYELEKKLRALVRGGDDE